MHTRILLITLLFMLHGSVSQAGGKRHRCMGQWDVATVSFTRDGRSLGISFDIDLSTLKVPSEEALLLTPVLRSTTSADSLVLPSVGVYGRNRYYHYLRQDAGMISGPEERTFRNAAKPATLPYTAQVEHRPWMDCAQLAMRADCLGCCFTVLAHAERTVGEYFKPDFANIKPAYLVANAQEVLTKELSGQAMIQFVVNRTEVKPDWRDNYRELSRITHSIDTVKADPDFTITEVWLKGYASPESPYTHNRDLARGRTESLKQYVNNLYRFPAGIVKTDYEPEDWAGLRRYVDKSNLDNRTAILNIIDNESNNDPDRKEALIKSRYPKEYAFLLEHAYPPLRHTEYKIQYTVRKAIDINEIKQRLISNPSKLTLNDFYLAANTYDAGTAEFNEVFDICARVYPDSEIANLNAANAALQAGRTDMAEHYLQKAGDGVEAQYARGILLLQREQYEAALPYIQTAADARIEGADTVLIQLKRMNGNNK